MILAVVFITLAMILVAYVGWNHDEIVKKLRNKHVENLGNSR